MYILDDNKFISGTNLFKVVQRQMHQNNIPQAQTEVTDFAGRVMLPVAIDAEHSNVNIEG